MLPRKDNRIVMFPHDNLRMALAPRLDTEEKRQAFAERQDAATKDKLRFCHTQKEKK